MTQPDYLAILRERGAGLLDQKMGIELLEASPTRLVARMPVKEILNLLDFFTVAPMLYSPSHWALSEPHFMQDLIV